MNLTFWVNFFVLLGQAELANSSVLENKPGEKAALENLITAGQGVITAIQDGQ